MARAKAPDDAIADLAAAMHLYGEIGLQHAHARYESIESLGIGCLLGKFRMSGKNQNPIDQRAIPWQQLDRPGQADQDEFK